MFLGDVLEESFGPRSNMMSIPRPIDSPIDRRRSCLFFSSRI